MLLTDSAEGCGTEAVRFDIADVKTVMLPHFAAPFRLANLECTTVAGWARVAPKRLLRQRLPRACYGLAGELLIAERQGRRGREGRGGSEQRSPRHRRAAELDPGLPVWRVDPRRHRARDNGRGPRAAREQRQDPSDRFVSSQLCARRRSEGARCLQTGHHIHRASRGATPKTRPAPSAASTTVSIGPRP